MKTINKFGIEVSEEAVCPLDKLCRFETIDDYDQPDSKWGTGHLVDRCIKCGKRLIYLKAKGKIDQERMVRNRIRDTVQPNGRNALIFEWLYGRVDDTGKTERSGV